MYTCPVLAFTPFVQDVFAWFALTHTLDVGLGWVRWVRSALPNAGGVAAQPAKLMAALDYLAQHRNAVLAGAMTKAEQRRRQQQREREAAAHG